MYFRCFMDVSSDTTFMSHFMKKILKLKFWRSRFSKSKFSKSKFSTSKFLTSKFLTSKFSKWKFSTLKFSTSKFSTLKFSTLKFSTSKFSKSRFSKWNQNHFFALIFMTGVLRHFQTRFYKRVEELAQKIQSISLMMSDMKPDSIPRFLSFENCLGATGEKRLT